jgi:hypothetical protein
VTTEADRYAKGKRIQVHPATDAWMMGDRYGVIIGRTLGRLAHDSSRGVRVRMDKSQQIKTFRPGDVLVEYLVAVMIGGTDVSHHTVFAASSGQARQVIIDRYPEWHDRPAIVRLK